MVNAAQIERAGRFADLHRAGDPLILANLWDACSAAVAAEAAVDAGRYGRPGAARVSCGPYPYRRTMHASRREAEALYSAARG